jgi:hypothetical protein
MTFCNVCKAHSQPDEVCKTHASDSWRKCRYHDRYAGDDKLDVTVVCEPCDLSAVAPDVSAALPKTPGRKERLPEPSIGKASGAPSGATTWSATEILTKLFDNEISRVAAEQLLMLRIAKESVSEDERKVLQSTLKTVQAYQGAVAGSAREEDISKAAKELLHLQQRNGKRVGMLMATHRRVYSELHLKTRTPSMQQVYKNAETGESMVAAEATQDVNDPTLLHMVLVDFVYVCTAYMLLTATEGRGLHKWVCKQMYLGVSATPLVIYRTVSRILQHLDESEIGNDLTDIIDNHGTAYLAEETSIARRPPGGGQYPHSPHAPGNSGASSDMPPKGDKSLAVPCPRPNTCWSHTNGYACTSLKDDGTCKFEQHHNKCGFRYHEGSKTQFCSGEHRAVDCPRRK